MVSTLKTKQFSTHTAYMKHEFGSANENAVELASHVYQTTVMGRN